MPEVRETAGPVWGRETRTVPGTLTPNTVTTITEASWMRALCCKTLAEDSTQDAVHLPHIQVNYKEKTCCKHLYQLRKHEPGFRPGPTFSCSCPNSHFNLISVGGDKFAGQSADSRGEDLEFISPRLVLSSPLESKSFGQFKQNK